MTDPWIRGIGHIEDLDGITICVGVEYDSITIGEHTLGLRQAVKLTALVFDAMSVAAEQADLLEDKPGQPDAVDKAINQLLTDLRDEA